MVPGVALGSVNPLGMPNYGDPDYPAFQISMLKYDPYPAEPGNYMTLWIEVYNTGTKNAEDVDFELVTEYPFSLDSSEVATREFPTVPGLYSIVLQYKVRVDKDAVEGFNEIKLRYKIGDGYWLEKSIEIDVAKPVQKAELEVFYAGATPKAYPGGTTTLSVDIANIASGTAYYTIVEADSEVAEIEISKIFEGTMNADDFDTLDFDMKINDGVEPGTYPVTIKSYYKDEDGKSYETEDVVNIKVYSMEEIVRESQTQTPWWQYLVYLIVALVVLKYFVVPAAKKSVSFFRKKNK